MVVEIGWEGVFEMGREGRGRKRKLVCPAGIATNRELVSTHVLNMVEKGGREDDGFGQEERAFGFTASLLNSFLSPVKSLPGHRGRCA